MKLSYPISNIIVVTHGGWKREVMNVVNVKEKSAPFFSGYVVQNCSISTVSIAAKNQTNSEHLALGMVLEEDHFKYDLVELNNTEHLKFLESL